MELRVWMEDYRLDFVKHWIDEKSKNNLTDLKIFSQGAKKKTAGLRLEL